MTICVRLKNFFRKNKKFFNYINDKDDYDMLYCRDYIIVQL